MKKQLILFAIILNIISLNVWGDSFSINYYHKGTIVHTQQITQGSAIGSFPNLTLTSCDDEINIFAGWITEADATNYTTANTTTPTFLTADYIPNTDMNLYALFADKDLTSEIPWQQVKSKSELKDNDKIIIAAHSYNYAIGATFNKDSQLNAVEITKSEDKSTISQKGDAQIFTLTKINNELWGIKNDNGYLSNTVKKEKISTITEIKTWSSWLFTFKQETHAVEIRNEYSDCFKYLCFNESYNFFACKEKATSYLSIYKQTINYVTCTTPDAVEYTITLHDNGNKSEIKCMSDASISQLEATQSINHWTFYGWATSPIDKTTTKPEIIPFPYTPTSNIDLYAVYSNTTADSLIMSDKTIPANWEVNETRSYNTDIALFNTKNHISIPKIENITTIEVKMKYTDYKREITLYIANQEGESLFTKKASSDYKTYTLSFNKPTSTGLNITSSAIITYNSGIAIQNITIHHQPIYSSEIEEDIRHTIHFKSNSDNDTTLHYSISQSQGKNVKLPKNTFSNDLDFIEWNTSADGLGTKYNDEATIENISNDITLFAQWGTVQKVESQEILSIDENKTINKLIVKSDIQGNTGEIKINNNSQLIVSNGITFEKEIDNRRYHFFTLPFDCNITDIKAINSNNDKLTYAQNSTEGDWVICYYDQTLAANNAGNSNTNAWVEILNSDYILKANQGYIVGHFCNDEIVTIKFTSKEHQIITPPKNITFNLGTDYQWYTAGEQLSANGWNLIGSPYYETLSNGTLTQFVTIPNSDGRTYTQCLYSDALEQRLIKPFCSFFVQLAENSAPTITTQSVNNTPSSNYKSEIITISITNSTNKSDHTTIINNNDCTAEYEIGSDLKKWIGYADIPQIYTIENEIPLAYNSQKINHSTRLSLGVYSPTEGEYTFTANKNYSNVYLIDKQTDITTNLAQSNYTTYLSQGIHNNRFEISFPKSTSTNLNIHNIKIEYFTQNGTVYITNLPKNAIIYVYDCNGKMIDKTILDHYALPAKGLYHIIIMENDTKIDNFDVIY